LLSISIAGSMAEEAFNSFDFDSDAEWNDYFGRVTIPADRPYDETVVRMKRKWFKKNKDSSLDLDGRKPAAADSTPNTSSTKTPPPTPQPVKSEPKTMRAFFLRQETLYFLMSVWLCYNAIMYILPYNPFGISSEQSYHRACNAAFVKYLSKFFQKHGISFSGIISTCKGLYNKEYNAAMRAQQIVNNNNLHNAFIYFLFNSTPPIPLAVVPIFLSSLYSICEWQVTLLGLVLPAYAEKISAPLQKFLKHGKTNPETGYINILYWNAWLNFGIAGVLFVQLFTPARSFLLFIVYIQFLLIRHTAPDARHQKIVTAELKAKTDGVFHHPRCPGIIGRGYDMVLKGLASVTSRAT